MNIGAVCARPPIAFRGKFGEMKQALLEDLDTMMEALTARLYEEGSDPSTVAKLMKEKEEGETRIYSLYEEVRKTSVMSCNAVECVKLWSGREIAVYNSHPSIDD